MIENATFTAPGGIRLDAALLMQFPSTTRAFAREACGAGMVRVNGRPSEKGLKLRGGETVEVTELAEAADNRAQPNRAVRVACVFEDEVLLGFDKPADQPVQPLDRRERDTLVNGVVARWPEVAEVGDQPLMAGALHRIDAGTSGLVLVARTQAAFEAMRGQFAARAVKKTYLALVEGTVAAGGTLENDLVHDPTLPYCRMIDVSRLRAPARTAPLKAVTSFKPLAFTREGQEDRTLLEVTIYTGVTHQIRAQLALAGLHIVNDRLYGAFAVEDMKGHLLHALAAEFHHPVSGGICRIETSWPDWALSALG